MQHTPTSKSTTKSVKKKVTARNPNKCGLCGKSGKLTKTECCDEWICEDWENYEMFTYTDNSCSRNHQRYTLCALHHEEYHDRDDWRTCKECRNYISTTEMYVWYGTNSYNFKILEKPPKYKPTRCADCKNIIKLATEGHVLSYTGEYFCTKCNALRRGKSITKINEDAEQDLINAIYFQDELTKFLNDLKETSLLNKRIQRVCLTCAEIIEMILDKSIPDRDVRSHVFQRWSEQELRELTEEIKVIQRLLN